MVGRPGAGRRLRPRLRRGGAADRGRLGVLLALQGTRPLRRAARARVHPVPARAGAGAQVPAADRRARRHPRPDLRLPRGRDRAADRDPPGERHRPPGAHAGAPRGLARHAGQRRRRPAAPGLGRDRGHAPARAVPAARRPRAAAARLGAAPGAAARLRRRRQAARHRPRRGLQRLAGPPRPLGRPRRRPPGRQRPGQKRLSEFPPGGTSPGDPPVMGGLPPIPPGDPRAKIARRPRAIGAAD